MTITRTYEIETLAEFAEFCQREIGSLGLTSDDTAFDNKSLSIVVEEDWFEDDGFPDEDDGHVVVEEADTEIPEES